MSGFTALLSTKPAMSLLRSAVGETHVLRSGLWWTIPIPIFIDRFGIPLGSQPIRFALARHSGVHMPVISRHRVTWSFLDQSNHLPIKIGTFRFLGLNRLCFGFCFAGPLPLLSLTHGPLLRVHFGESLVLDHTQKSTISIAVKLSVSAIIYPWWTATKSNTPWLYF